MLMKAAEGYVCISPAASGVKDIVGRTAVCVSTTKLHTGRQNAMVALFILQGGAAFTAPAGEGLVVGSKYRNGVQCPSDLQQAQAFGTMNLEQAMTELC